MAKRPVELDDAVRIDEAYDDLTREAFAVWIRMMVDGDVVLHVFGITALALRYNYKKRQFSTILRQLRNKGYVRFATPPRGKPAVIKIAKRPLLVGYNRFVKLS